MNDYLPPSAAGDDAALPVEALEPVVVFEAAPVTEPPVGLLMLLVDANASADVLRQLHDTLAAAFEGLDEVRERSRSSHRACVPLTPHTPKCVAVAT
jgi:hypothetical protein